ncbi:MAG: ImmA/IrrE family metallo-endopeptidase [Pseudomonadota bacterium]
MRWLVLYSVFLLLACGARAQDLANLYPEHVLTEDQPRFERRIGQIYELGLVGFLDGEERRALADVRLELPLVGINGSPFDFYAYRDRTGPAIAMPVLSLKLIEDLSIAWAWRQVHGYSLEPFDEYVAMLKYREPSDFPDSQYPDPLTALGAPPLVWETEPDVDDLSLRLRNSAWAFILAHEMGHVRHAHLGNAEVDPATSQQQEREADRFAVNLLSRSETIPMGAILWFQATAGFFPNRADFNTDEAFLAWQKREATHPINPERLRTLALALYQNAEDSLDPAYADTLRFIATRLAAIGDTLDDPDMQRLIARKAVTGDPADLQRR